MPKKQPEAEKENRERWLLTYADMITLLLALFVVLFATSKIDATKFEVVAASFQRVFNPGAQKSAPATNNVVAIGNQPNAFVGLTGIGASIGPELISYAQEHEFGDQVSVTASKDAVVITLQGALVFGSGSAELRQEGKDILGQVGLALQALADQNMVRVEGHTDNAPTGSGRFPSNWELSAARAGTAAHFLNDAGVAAERMAVVGMADTRPIGDNGTPEGRTRNRRVEIWILNPEAQGPLAQTPASRLEAARTAASPVTPRLPSAPAAAVPSGPAVPAAAAGR